MSLPDQTPKLPKLPFLFGDAALLALAWFIFQQSRGPLGLVTVVAVTGCVVAGCIVGIIPFMTDYARKQDEALDERQRGLEALSRTINTAAEQISIAANGLHEITELAYKNLKHAEQLPQKLHEKITEFNAQLDNAREDDREELEKELAELRVSESERLQAIADKVHQAVAELTKLDATAQKHLTARTEFIERVGETIAQSHAAATASLNAAITAVSRELAAAETRALADIEAKFAERTAAALAAIESATVAARATIPSPAVATILPFPTTAVVPIESVDQETASHAPQAELASPPKRPRKARREEPAPVAAEPVSSSMETAGPKTPSTPPAPPAPTEPFAAAPEVSFTEPAPIPVETIPVVEPVAPVAADPFTPPLVAEPAVPAENSPTPPADPTPPPPPPVERPARKRAVRKPDPEPTADLPLDLGGDETPANPIEDSPITHTEAMERVISSDGATRLIATAYIGIGNRLFIRGDGPDLSWEKGVPLQFISIGKWRWETSEATAPISFKLYKNDVDECASLGKLTLDPGHQQEVLAKF